MKRTAVIAVIMACISVSLWRAPSAYAVYWRSDLDTALSESARTGQEVMLYFWSPSCEWCALMDRKTFADAEVNRLAQYLICVQVDYDERLDLRQKHKVAGRPSVIFLNSKGEMTDKVVGYKDPTFMIMVMKTYVRKPREEVDLSKKISQLKKIFKRDAPKKRKTTKPVQTAGKAKLVLDGVVPDPKKTTAVINGTIVGVGETVDGAKVLEISPSGVKVLYEGKETLLKLQ